MFICEHCRGEIVVDRTDDAAEIMLALTAHQLDDCVSTPRWAASMPDGFKPAA